MFRLVALMALAAAGARAGLVFDTVSLLGHSLLPRDDPTAAMSFPQAAGPWAVLARANGTVFGSTDGGRSFHAVERGSLDVSVPVDAAGQRRLLYSGDIPTWYTNATAITHAASPVVTEWEFVPRTGDFVRTSNPNSSRLITFAGLPRPVVELSVSSGGAVRHPSDKYVAVVVVWFLDAEQGPLPGPCCRDSVLAFTSDDGFAWTFASEIAGPASVPNSQEGPNETFLTVLRDNKTLMCVFRVDGGDGEPDHKHTPYMQTFSTDQGRTWSTPRVMASDVLSAKPILATLPCGTVLLSGGRPGLRLWENSAGDGQQWTTYDIPTEHNKLMAEQQWRFCPEFLNATQALKVGLLILL